MALVNSTSQLLFFLQYWAFAGCPLFFVVRISPAQKTDGVFSRKIVRSLLEKPMKIISIKNQHSFSATKKTSLPAKAIKIINFKTIPTIHQHHFFRKLHSIQLYINYFCKFSIVITIFIL